MAAPRFNFSIIYDSNDDILEFVEYLVESLEREVGKDGKSLVGYYADRDLFPGRLLLDENISVITNSDYTIVVFDKGFITNSWPMYLNTAALTMLIDEGPGLDGYKRFIPIAFNLEPDTIAKNCAHLACQEVMYFNDKYKDDKRNQQRLLRVVKEGLPMNDEEIHRVPETFENRGPSNQNPSAEGRGCAAD